jgi:hypothetical protein
MQIFKIKKIYKSIVLVIIVLIFIMAYANVPVNITTKDAEVFKNLKITSEIARKLNYDEQILLIKEIQLEIFRRAPLGDGIPEYKSREPLDLLLYGKGLCYDRSRTIDKALKYAGFETRHVYLLYKENKYLIRALLTYKQTSHAVTEVKTEKGWIMVDSNQPWISISKDGFPIKTDEIYSKKDDFLYIPEYLKYEWWAIRGLYSRKGSLYSKWFFFPEFNWHDFFYWVVNE